MFKRLLITSLVALVCVAMPSQAGAKKVTWKTSGASVFTDGGQGSCGRYLYSQYAPIAELGMGSFMGSLPCGTKVRIYDPRTGRKVTARKWDIGLGGGRVFGFTRAVDLHCITLQKLAPGASCSSWTGVIRWRVIWK